VVIHEIDITIPIDVFIDRPYLVSITPSKSMSRKNQFALKLENMLFTLEIKEVALVFS
tara:strand:+ start:251 stop:424 length:174 start_codon:yes stop_codon:yes gene_type:complete